MREIGARILLVDDDKDLCELLSLLIKRAGLTPLIAHDGETALQMIQLSKPDALLVDMKMPGINGMDVLRRAMELDRDLPVIIITAYAEIYGAVEAMRAGAFYYLAKPFEHHDVIKLLRRALAHADRKQKLCQSSHDLQINSNLKEVMGSSDAICRLVEEVNRVALSDFTVLIEGETGAGKELVSRAIHNASPRSKAPFVPVECGAIPETLLESELFGHEKGAFTHAHQRKPGKFEAAQGGTLFLDEISNMPLGSQGKLLRVLQEKRICRVGATQPIDVDIRLLAASNQNLLELCVSAAFRRDLFYRLNEFTITIPPLRERMEDIAYLAKRFLHITNIELNKTVKGFSKSAIAFLLAYQWPGNVRQLRSTIRRAVLMADDIITEEHLDMLDKKEVHVPDPSFKSNVEGMLWKSLSLKEIVRSCTIPVEREVLIKALHITGGNKAKAARLLHIDYKTIHSKVKQYGINVNGGELYG
jgi:DNA-binding NtrC family response regulator